MPDDDKTRPPLPAADAVEHAIRRAIEARGAPGILADIAGAHIDGGGKRFRARLAKDAAAALAAPDATTWAAAVELIHEASLIHDDLQDGDRVRRGRPATWVTYGAAQAVNAGDFLLLLPFTLFPAEPQGARLMHALATAAVAMARGQAEEPGLIDLLEQSPRELGAAYTRCVEQKTGALFGVAVEGAALLAGLSREDAARAAQPFAALGALFQIVDDVVDLYGDKGRDKRGNDIREGKVSALVAAHAALHPDDAARVAAVLRLPRDETGDDVVGALAADFERGGALARVRADIDARARAVVLAPVFSDHPLLLHVALDVLVRVRGLLATCRFPPANAGAAGFEPVPAHAAREVVQQVLP